MPSRSADVDAEDPTLCTGNLEPPAPGPVLGGVLTLAATLGGQPLATCNGQRGVVPAHGGP
jgi:hypothetical protein